MTWEQERRGQPIGDMDVATASVALAEGACVATHDRRHLSRIEGLILSDRAAAG